MKAFLIIILILILGAVGMYSISGVFRPTPQPEPSVTQEIPVYEPDYIVIPKLELNADIEIVGKDSQGRMDVPKASENVAWYNLGFRPGEKGSAVVAGHLDRQDGSTAVFARLQELQQGDGITVVDENGRNHNFVVTSSEIFDNNAFPLERVFNTKGEATLNLITCEGTFINGNYTQRLVVFAVKK